MAAVPWLKKQWDKVKDKDQLKSNTAKENELLQTAKDRWEISNAGKVDFTQASLYTLSGGTTTGSTEGSSGWSPYLKTDLLL